MKGKLFVDTNILIYLFSNTEPEKRRSIADFFASIANKNPIVWSTQIMQELYVVLTKKYDRDPIIVKQILPEFDNFEMVINNKHIINQAIDIQVTNLLSFWDALVISSAVESKCSYLLTEDLNHGQKIRGISVHNPFKT